MLRYYAVFVLLARFIHATSPDNSEREVFLSIADNNYYVQSTYGILFDSNVKSHFVCSAFCDFFLKRYCYHAQN